MRKIYIICRRFSMQMSRQNISAYASSTAFFFFLSFIPMIIFMCTILPYTPLSEDDLISFARYFVPEAYDSFIVGIISQVYEKSAGILSVAVFFTVWSAGKGFLALIRGLNAINNVVEKRNYILLRLVACFYTILFLTVIILTLLIMVFGKLLVKQLTDHYVGMYYIFDALVHFRFIFGMIVMTFAFSLLYTFVPNKKMSLLLQFPGAMLATVIWVLFSWGFSVYVEYYADTAYGTLSLVMVMLLWLYIGMYIIMIGAYVNRYFQGDYKRVYRKVKEKKASLLRKA